MNVHTTKQTGWRARKVRRDCSGEECPAGARNNYFPGKPMTPESHRLEQSYGIDRRRLINRAVHGWGVVYGYRLRTAEEGKDEPEPGGLFIGEGLAFDRLGRELIQTRGLGFTLDNFLILDDDGRPVRVDGDLDERLAKLPCTVDKCWMLRVHYAEQKVGPLTLHDPCNCNRKEWERTCETVVYSLQAIDCDKCCVPYECELHCCCPDSPCCREHDGRNKDLGRLRQDLVAKFRAEVERLREAGDDGGYAKLKDQFEDELARLDEERRHVDRETHARGGCACLCEHLTDLKVGGDGCVRLKEVDGCTRADLAHGVDLACLRLGRDRCDDWGIVAIHDACGPRRLVKRNDLLFDLINGCDLTRIVETGWGRWNRRAEPVPFERFIEALGWPDGDSNYEEYPTRDFWVRFSRPVRADTLTPEIFSVVVMSDHGDDFWRRSYRVPILAVEADEAREDDPKGHFRRAKMLVSTLWLENAFTDNDTIFAQGETRVEIEVRGCLVEDCLGQAVQGGCLSVFPVSQRPRPRRTESRPPRSRGRPPATQAS